MGIVLVVVFGGICALFLHGTPLAFAGYLMLAASVVTAIVLVVRRVKTGRDSLGIVLRKLPGEIWEYLNPRTIGRPVDRIEQRTIWVWAILIAPAMIGWLTSALNPGGLETPLRAFGAMLFITGIVGLFAVAGDIRRQREAAELETESN